MKRVYKFTLGTGFQQQHEENIEFDFDDNMTEKQIEAELSDAWNEWIGNYISGGWEEV